MSDDHRRSPPSGGGGTGGVVGGLAPPALLLAVVSGVVVVVGAVAVLRGALRRDVRRPPAAPVLVALLALGAAGLLPPLSASGAAAAAQGATTGVGVAALVVLQLHLLRRRLATSSARSWLDLATGVPGCLAVVWAFAAPSLAAATGTSAAGAALLLTPLGLTWLAVTFAMTSTTLLRPVDRRMALLAAASLALLAGEVGSASAVAGQAWGDVVAAGARPAAAALVALAAVLHDPHDAARAEESGFDIVLGPVAQTSISIGLLAWFVASPTNPAMAWAALATVVMTLVKTVVVFQQLDVLNGLRAQATTDALTGLGNRRALEDALAAVDAGRPTGLVVIDLDRFKAVNDTLGHTAGDELLVELASRLRGVAQDDDVVVRTGGDEFALVVPGGDAGVARQRAERVVEALRAPVHLRGGDVEGESEPVQVGASAGVAVAPLHARSSESLREVADAAMYAAKAAEGDGVVVAAPDDDTTGREDERRRGDRRTAERRGGTVS